MSAPASFRERLSWHDDGEIRDGDIRYLMLRADALMGVFRALPAEHRGPALAAFATSIVRHGGKSAKAYQAMGADDGARLLEVIRSTAPQLGWGRWSVLGHAPDRIEIEVHNSPFAAGWRLAEGEVDVEPSAVCTPIVGMLTVVGAMVLGREVRVRETACACTGHAPACRFEVRSV
ncbi:MAG: 4-vinyl reductase [Burkholderiaceae bacterium]